jgi:hypothetical protein
MSRPASHPVNAARRALLRTLTLAAGAAAVVKSGRARAGEPSKVDPKGPDAVALGYVEDAALVDSKKYPTFAKGSTCENCLLLEGKEGSSYRPCSLFPGKLVAIKGWCTGWSAEI